MNLQAIYARHLVELGYLEAIIQEMGYATQLIESSDTVPYHTLLARLDPDGKGRPREMACTFYPLSEEESANVLLLQYFLELPFEIAPGAIAEVNGLLVELNNQSVLGHFGITAGTQKVHHRFVQTLAQSSFIDEAATSDIVNLLNYTSLMLGESIEAVATRQKVTH
jgi:hypothetical protein